MGHNNIQTMSLLTALENKNVSLVLTPQELRHHMMMKGSSSERSEYTRAVSIEVDSYRMALRFMEGLLERAKRSKCPGGLWILGKGGQGKSFILESFMRRHPPVETTEGRKCEILHVTFRGRPSESDILLRILLQLGQNPGTLVYQSNADLQRIVERAMVHCGVRMILFDESQHLWLSSNGKVKHYSDRFGGPLGDFLKRLYDNTGVAYVFAGTPGLDMLIKEDTQASTRWAGVLRLESFENDMNFRSVLYALDEALPMEVAAGLSGDELCGKIFEASQGNFRRLKNFISEAVFLAAREGVKSIQDRHLANAFFMVNCGENTPFGEAN